MQLEYILQAHGLAKGGSSDPLPELTNFIATSKNDGSGTDLSWTNSSVAEYVKTEIFSSESNIQNSNYEYCVANATKIVDSNSLAAYTDIGHATGTTVYYKGFMTFTTFGVTEVNKGTALSCVVLDTTPPGTIMNFAATTADGTVNLTWTNPTDTDFNKTKILMKAGSYPTSPTDGTVVYEGSGTSDSTTALTNGTA